MLSSLQLALYPGHPPGEYPCATERETPSRVHVKQEVTLTTQGCFKHPSHAQEPRGRPGGAATMWARTLWFQSWGRDFSLPRHQLIKPQYLRLHLEPAYEQILRTQHPRPSLGPETHHLPEAEHPLLPISLPASGYLRGESEGLTEDTFKAPSISPR